MARKKRKKLTARQRKIQSLDRAIETILDGGSSSLQGISIIKSKRDQNLLKQALTQATGSGMSSTDFKRLYGLNKNFSGMSKRSLKKTNQVIDSAQEKTQVITGLRAKQELANSTGRKLGDPVVDIIELLGYDWEQIDVHGLYNRLEDELLNRTSMLEILEKNYEKAYPWIVSFIKDHIQQYVKTNRPRDMDSIDRDIDDINEDGYY